MLAARTETQRLIQFSEAESLALYTRPVVKGARFHFGPWLFNSKWQPRGRSSNGPGRKRGLRRMHRRPPEVARGESPFPGHNAGPDRSSKCSNLGDIQRPWTMQAKYPDSGGPEKGSYTTGHGGPRQSLPALITLTSDGRHEAGTFSLGKMDVDGGKMNWRNIPPRLIISVPNNRNGRVVVRTGTDDDRDLQKDDSAKIRRSATPTSRFRKENTVGNMDKSDLKDDVILKAEERGGGGGGEVGEGEGEKRRAGGGRGGGGGGMLLTPREVGKGSSPLKEVMSNKKQAPPTSQFGDISLHMRHYRMHHTVMWTGRASLANKAPPRSVSPVQWTDVFPHRPLTPDTSTVEMPVFRFSAADFRKAAAASTGGPDASLSQVTIHDMSNVSTDGGCTDAKTTPRQPGKAETVNQSTYRFPKRSTKRVKDGFGATYTVYNDSIWSGKRRNSCQTARPGDYTAYVKAREKRKNISHQQIVLEGASPDSNEDQVSGIAVSKSKLDKEKPVPFTFDLEKPASSIPKHWSQVRTASPILSPVREMRYEDSNTSGSRTARERKGSDAEGIAHSEIMIRRRILTPGDSSTARARRPVLFVDEQKLKDSVEEKIGNDGHRFARRNYESGDVSKLKNENSNKFVRFLVSNEEDTKPNRFFKAKRHGGRISKENEHKKSKSPDGIDAAIVTAYDVQDYEETGVDVEMPVKPSRISRTAEEQRYSSTKASDSRSPPRPATVGGYGSSLSAFTHWNPMDSYLSEKLRRDAKKLTPFAPCAKDDTSSSVLRFKPTSPATSAFVVAAPPAAVGIDSRSVVLPLQEFMRLAMEGKQGKRFSDWSHSLNESATKNLASSSSSSSSSSFRCRRFPTEGLLRVVSFATPVNQFIFAKRVTQGDACRETTTGSPVFSSERVPPHFESHDTSGRRKKKYRLKMEDFGLTQRVFRKEQEQELKIDQEEDDAKTGRSAADENGLSQFMNGNLTDENEEECRRNEDKSFSLASEPRSLKTQHSNMSETSITGVHLPVSINKEVSESNTGNLSREQKEAQDEETKRVIHQDLRRRVLDILEQDQTGQKSSPLTTPYRTEYKYAFNIASAPFIERSTSLLSKKDLKKRLFKKVKGVFYSNTSESPKDPQEVQIVEKSPLMLGQYGRSETDLCMTGGSINTQRIGSFKESKTEERSRMNNRLRIRKMSTSSECLFNLNKNVLCRGEEGKGHTESKIIKSGTEREVLTTDQQEPKLKEEGNSFPEKTVRSVNDGAVNATNSSNVPPKSDSTSDYPPAPHPKPPNATPEQRPAHEETSQKNPVSEDIHSPITEKATTTNNNSISSSSNTINSNNNNRPNLQTQSPEVDGGPKDDVTSCFPSALKVTHASSDIGKGSYFTAANFKPKTVRFNAKIMYSDGVSTSKPLHRKKK